MLNREEGGNGHLLEGGKGLCVRRKEEGNGHVLKGQTIDSYMEFMNIRFLNWTTHTTFPKCGSLAQLLLFLKKTTSNMAAT